jgi:hypothetical protein
VDAWLLWANQLKSWIERKRGITLPEPQRKLLALVYMLVVMNFLVIGTVVTAPQVGAASFPPKGIQSLTSSRSAPAAEASAARAHCAPLARPRSHRRGATSNRSPAPRAPRPLVLIGHAAPLTPY